MLPAELVTVSVTVYFPVLEYLCVGFCRVDDVPSPKFHFHAVGIPVLVSLNAMFNGAFPDVTSLVKLAIGFVFPDLDITRGRLSE